MWIKRTIQGKNARKCTRHWIILKKQTECSTAVNLAWGGHPWKLGNFMTVEKSHRTSGLVFVGSSTTGAFCGLMTWTDMKHFDWCQPNTAHQQKYSIPSMTLGGGSIMLWTCFCAAHPGGTVKEKVRWSWRTTCCRRTAIWDYIYISALHQCQTWSQHYTRSTSEQQQ